MASPPHAAKLKTTEQEYKNGIAVLTRACEHLLKCEEVHQRRLQTAQRQTQACARAIDSVFANNSYPTDALTANLQEINARAFVLESSMKACDEEFHVELRRVEALFQNLILKRQQSNLLLLQNQLNQRLHTIKLGTPLQLGKISRKLALIAEDLENYPAQDIKEDALLLCQASFAAVKKQQESLWQQDQPATSIANFLAELELFAKNPPHDCATQGIDSAEIEKVLLPFRIEYEKLKKCL